VSKPFNLVPFTRAPHSLHSGRAVLRLSAKPFFQAGKQHAAETRSNAKPMLHDIRYLRTLKNARWRVSAMLHF
jgi:hypothetical protein